MIEIVQPEIHSEEKPEKLDHSNIIYWSNYHKRLMNVEKGKGIATKARRFIKEKAITYDPEFQRWLVGPIRGTKRTNKVESNGDHFQCSCQFYNTVSHKWDHPVCSHIAGVQLSLEIARWNK